MSIESAFESYREDIVAVDTWCSTIYDSEFAPLFIRQVNLLDRLNSKLRPITDAELEDIIINIPLELFEVSEKLASIQTQKKVIELALKKKIAQTSASLHESLRDDEIRQTLDDVLMEDKVLLVAYDYIISRVEKQMSYSRELIMGAKKVWDARRRTECINPIKEQDVDALPDYVPKESGKKYVK